MRTRHMHIAITVLLLCAGIGSSGITRGDSFVVSPCIDFYTSVPGNCPSMEPLAMAVYQTGPSVAYDAGRNMILFFRDGNAYLQYIVQKPGNTAVWDPRQMILYGRLNGDPVAITRKDGSLDVFYVSLDEAIWHIRQLRGSGWGHHTVIGGAAGGQVTVAYNSATADQAQLFYKGDNQSLMTIVENGGAWGQPVSVLPPGSVTGNIASMDFHGNRYLFYRAADGSMRCLTLIPGSTTASAPVTLTKPWAVTSNISPILDAGNNIVLLFRGPDSALWEVPPAGGGWGFPVSLGGRVSSDLYVTSLPGKQIRVYYRATDGGLYYVQQDQSASNGWGRHRHLLGMSASAKDTSGSTLLSQTLFSNPVVGVTPDQRQEVFYAGNEGIIWYLWETTASSSSQPYPAWSKQAPLGDNGLAPRGNSIIAAAAVGIQPVASYTTVDAATAFDIIENAPYFDSCTPAPNPVIGFNHSLASCNGVPVKITPAMGIALLIDDIQTAISVVKASTTGSLTQAQFDALIKAQLMKMGIL